VPHAWIVPGVDASDRRDVVINRSPGRRRFHSVPTMALGREERIWAKMKGTLQLVFDFLEFSFIDQLSLESLYLLI